MRLTTEQARIIRQAGQKVLGQQVLIRLFGSRARDDLKGGDIDLYFETNNVIENRAQAICKLQGALMWTLGDRKIDILLKDARTPENAIFKIARETGVTL